MSDGKLIDDFSGSLHITDAADARSQRDVAIVSVTFKHADPQASQATH